MEVKKWVGVFLTLVLFGLVPTEVSANGVVRTGNCIGAEQCGAGISGIATATDASVPYANPAGLAEQQGGQNGWYAQIGFDVMVPRFRHVPPFQLAPKAVSSEKHVLVLPIGMAATDLTPNLRAGVFSEIMYGLRTDFAEWRAQLFHEQRGKITFRADGIVVGLRLLDNALFLGASAFHVDSDIDTADGLFGTRRTIKTDGDGWGGTVGLRWRPIERLTLGAVYRSPVRVETSGDSLTEIQFTRPPFVLLKDTVKTDFTFPESWGVGAAYWLIPRQIRVVGEWTYFKQSRADDLFLRFGSGTITHVKLDWRDTQAYQLGLEWIVNPTLSWRAGGGWVGAAIPRATVSPIFFDAPGWDVATGVTKRWGPWKLDAFFMYVWAPTRTVQLGEGTNPGEYWASIPQFGFSISRTF